MAGWAGVAIVAAATLLGVIATILLKKDPGTLLGGFILVGTVIAGFAVRYNVVYGLIPVPALAYVIGAMVPGYIHERAVITGHLELAAHAAEWIGFGFLSMIAGTIAAIVVTIGRYGWARRSMLTARGRAAPPSDRPRPPVPPSADGRFRETARSGRPGTAPAFTPSTAYSGPPGSGDRPRPPAGGPGRPVADPTLGSDPRRPGRPGSAPDGDPYSRYYDEGESWR
jgi:hypothetical protein